MAEALSRIRSACAFAALALAACAASPPQRSAEWIDPALGASSGVLRGQRVLVACEAWDLAMRQNCQESLFRQLQARGANPVTPPFDPPAGSSREFESQLMAHAASAGARTVLVVALTPASFGGGGFSGASIGIGGFSFGNSGGGGIGLSAPIGGSGWGNTGFAAQGRITDVPNQRLLWSTTFVASPSADFAAQVRELTGSVVNAAQGAGLL